MSSISKKKKIKYTDNIIPSQTNTLNKKKKINTILSQVRISIGIWIHEGHNKKERFTHRVITSFIHYFSSKYKLLNNTAPPDSVALQSSVFPG